MSRSAVRRIGLVGLILLAANLQLSAAEPAGAVCSVEKLRSLLQSIDPYQPAHIAAGKISVFGSSAMDGLAYAWSDNFREFHPEIQVELSSLNDLEAMKRLVNEPTGLWLLSRPVKADELALLKSQGLREPVAFEVAREALGVFVHESNSVSTISGEQLRAVFSAELPESPTWKLLGATGPMADKPIHIISRKSDSGTQRFLQDVVFGSRLREGVVVESNAKVVDAIKDNPLAIGICGLRCGNYEARPLSLQVGGGSIPSDELAILSGQYPLIRPLSVVVDLAAVNNQAAVEFVRYMLSQSGQAENVLAATFPSIYPCCGRTCHSTASRYVSRWATRLAA